MNTPIQRIREVQTDLRSMSHIPEIRELCEANDARLQAVVESIEPYPNPHNIPPSQIDHANH